MTSTQFLPAELFESFLAVIANNSDAVFTEVTQVKSGAYYAVFAGLSSPVLIGYTKAKLATFPTIGMYP
jgi:hypothetical protein